MKEREVKQPAALQTELTEKDLQHVSGGTVILNGYLHWCEQVPDDVFEQYFNQRFSRSFYCDKFTSSIGARPPYNSCPYCAHLEGKPLPD